jgi:hypothetical protein
MPPPEPAALVGLEQIAQAELDHFRRHGAMWTGDVATLGVLQAADIAPRTAVADSRPWNGYWFLAMEIDGGGGRYDTGSGVNASNFAFCAYPDADGPTYIRDQSGATWAKENAGLVIRWPADPPAAGWTRIR